MPLDVLVVYTTKRLYILLKSILLMYGMRQSYILLKYTYKYTTGMYTTNVRIYYIC